jgi:hypothetical protein
MENLDGKSLSDSVRFKHWKCDHGHLLGVTERVRQVLEVRPGVKIRYHTTILLIFRTSVDLSVDVPTEIEVAGQGDGRILSIVWKCSVPGCGCIREWHPERDVVEFLAATYVAE